MLSLNESIKIAKRKLGEDLFDKLNIELSSSDSFIVKRNNNNITIFYHDLVEVFRGLTYIKEHIDNKSYEINITRRFNKNGLMLDCSRNGVVNLSSIKEMILIQALMGQNRLLLYTEDTYTVEKYPYFGYFRGPYTKEELKFIVDYAKSFGVEIIPCVQTLGHLNRFLHWEPNIHLSDGDTTLLIDDDKTYEFIEECIKFLRECFDSDEIHIGMDESTEIGLGKYLGKHGFTNRVELFTRHLSRVIDICKKYKFIPMIWSDMFFRLNASNEEYYRDSPLPEETLKLIPKNVSLVYWDYYHLEKEIYDRMNKYHKDTGRKVIFAGGAWRWKGFTPSINQSLTMSKLAIKSCLENKISDVFLTAWGDNGNECSIYSSLPTMALYSSLDYFDNADDKTLSSLLKAITGDELKDFLLMDIPDAPDGKILCAQYNPSKFFLYQDPLCGIFDKQVKPHFATTYKKNADILLKASERSRDYGYVYKNLSILCELLSYKVDLGVKLRAAYKTNDLSSLETIIKDIPLMVDLVDKLNENSKYQWDKENKPFGFDVIDGRLGYLKNRLITTMKVVNKFLNKELDKIEELEVEVLPFNGHDYEISWNWWINTVTTNYL